MKKGILLRDKCPTCNFSSSRSIFKRSFNEDIMIEYMNEAYQENADIDFLKDVIFEIVKCNNCNLSYQKYVLDQERLSELYNKWINPKLAEEWHDGKKIEKQNYNISILNFAKKQLKMKPSKIKLLDYGAGFGDSLLLAKEMGFDSYAYEYSNERIQYLEEKGIKTIGDKNEMLFDFIIVNEILEHLTYPNEILEAIISKLEKNGIVYIAVPNCLHIEKKLKKTDNITDAKEIHRILRDASVGAFQHINFFTNYSLKLILRRTGLKPITPLQQAFIKPLSIKSIIRPFYLYYFGSTFFASARKRVGKS